MDTQNVKSSRRWRVLLLVLAIAGTTIIGWVLFVALFPTWAGARAFTYAVNSIIDVSGWNRFLVQSAVILTLGPLVWAISELIRFALFERVADAVKGRPSRVVWRKRAAGAVIVCYMSGFWLMMYVAGRDGGFSLSTGESLRWYAYTPEGIREFDAPGYDPKYGIQLKPISPDIRQSVERAKLGQVPARMPMGPVGAIEFFDPTTNQPRIWYARSNIGTVDLFSGPGFHPTYGEPLKPITREIVSELERGQQNAALNEATEKVKQEAEQRRKEEAHKLEQTRQQEIAIADQRQAYIRRYLSNQSPPARILIAVDERDFFEPELTASLARIFAASGTFVKSAFASDGLFRRAIDGDESVLSDLGLSDRAVILVQRRTSIRSQGALEHGLVSADVTISVRVAGRQGHLPATLSATAIGPGFSEKQAIARAEELILPKLSSQLSPDR